VFTSVTEPVAQSTKVRAIVRLSRAAGRGARDLIRPTEFPGVVKSG